MADAGHEIASHTWTNPSLTELKPDELDEQFREISDAIHAHIGKHLLGYGLPVLEVWEVEDGRCALSGIGDASLLVASHIIPWSESVERRADPRIGILLNALFDRGLFTPDDNLRVIVSPKFATATHDAALPCGLDQLAGRAIVVPRRFPPDGEAIR